MADSGYPQDIEDEMDLAALAEGDAEPGMSEAELMEELGLTEADFEGGDG